MNKLKIFGTVSSAVAKAGGKALLKCKKISPELLLAGGIVCGVAAVVTAVIATKKACNDEPLRDIEEELEGVEAKVKKEKDKEVKKELRWKALKLWGKKGVRFLQLYAIPIGLTVLSIGLILGSHGILKGRYLGMAAAYTALDDSFKSYRQRIRDIAGEEAEARFYNGTEDLEITTVNEKGKKEKKTVQVRKPGIEKEDSPYEFDFNKHTAPFMATTDTAHNYMVLRNVQEWANDKLRAQGYLFLNTILEELSIDITKPGQHAGWLTNGDGDGYVDFGMSEYYEDSIEDIMNGTAVPNIHLNFNCDGDILEKM